MKLKIEMDLGNKDSTEILRILRRLSLSDEEGGNIIDIIEYLRSEDADEDEKEGYTNMLDLRYEKIGSIIVTR